MNLLLKLLWRPVSRRKVDREFLADFEAVFDAVLEKRGLKSIVSQPLLACLVEEAYSRAALQESDRVPRYNAMLEQVESIADKIADRFAGKTEADPAIDTILVHHGMKIPAKSLE